MVYQEQLNVSSNAPGHFQDLTLKIEKIVKESAVKRGIVNICNVGSTGVIGASEFEPGLGSDLAAALNRLFPPNGEYRHELAWHDGNGHSHVQAAFLGQSLTVPIGEGKLLLGTWQQIFHLECDTRPRKRSIIVTVLGE